MVLAKDKVDLFLISQDICEFSTINIIAFLQWKNSLSGSIIYRERQ